MTLDDITLPDDDSPVRAEVDDVADALYRLADALDVARWWDAGRQLRDLADRLEDLPV